MSCRSIHLTYFSLMPRELISIVADILIFAAKTNISNELAAHLKNIDNDTWMNIGCTPLDIFLKNKDNFDKFIDREILFLQKNIQWFEAAVVAIDQFKIIRKKSEDTNNSFYIIIDFNAKSAAVDYTILLVQHSKILDFSFSKIECIEYIVLIFDRNILSKDLSEGDVNLISMKITNAFYDQVDGFHFELLMVNFDGIHWNFIGKYNTSYNLNFIMKRAICSNFNEFLELLFKLGIQKWKTLPTYEEVIYDLGAGSIKKLRG